MSNLKEFIVGIVLIVCIPVVGYVTIKLITESVGVGS